jgi:hypothetical protein
VERPFSIGVAPADPLDPREPDVAVRISGERRRDRVAPPRDDAGVAPRPADEGVFHVGVGGVVRDGGPVDRAPVTVDVGRRGAPPVRACPARNVDEDVLLPGGRQGRKDRDEEDKRDLKSCGADAGNADDGGNVHLSFR